MKTRQYQQGELQILFKRKEPRIVNILLVRQIHAASERIRCQFQLCLIHNMKPHHSFCGSVIINTRQKQTQQESLRKSHTHSLAKGIVWRVRRPQPSFSRAGTCSSLALNCLRFRSKCREIYEVWVWWATLHLSPCSFTPTALEILTSRVFTTHCSPQRVQRSKVGWSTLVFA